MIKSSILLLATLAAVWPAPCGFGQDTNALAEAAKENGTNKSSFKERIARTYESIGATATNAVDWVKQDWARTGTWKYKLATFAASDPALEAKLNDLGKEGWECFWVRGGQDTLIMFFKKPDKGVITEALRHRP